MTFSLFLQHLTNALSLGSLYALIAIGYTMVYGILRLINFAHGDVFMLGAYIAFYLTTFFLLPWWAAFLVAIACTALFGIGLERTAYKPLRDSPKISIMISAIGASFLIENLATVLFGGRPKGFPVPPLFSKVLHFGSVSVVSVSVIIPVFTFALLALLLWIVHKTKTGMAMRAVSTDIDAARLQAIDVNRVVSFTFGLGSLLAAIGGILWALKYPQLNPTMGIMPGLKCFIAAVLGGIGNIMGAVLGGFLLGLIEIMIIAFLPDLTGYRDAFAFVALILVLLLKPAGLLGKNQVEKV
ncbi:branched-chain amino acid ABC transporter permease [Treponema zuelzerae]|uniref:Branched-chain amino acid ABC transporter permease n=1 Tax=Teretinema zuelzerae TaxID=156 RepID=A0AAE3EIH0_9SPIR|nr:branched-chain amino acid ABC transporter permease [Teretinema zuelzerae]MCD1655292.1 branched-chain amino acid ABC transporter permease [Teretinema zuelzerae]HPO03431.1 branched-chain amino acid ABC transporter permease [Treponemataceae bacterium]